MEQQYSKESFGMPRGALLRIEDGVGTLVHVWEGEVWLTQQGSDKDQMVGPGESFRIDRRGASIAHAFRRSVVSLSAPWEAPVARRVTLTRGPSAQPVLLYQRSSLYLLDFFNSIRRAGIVGQ